MAAKKNKGRVLANGSYPPIVITTIGWAYLIGRGPDGACLSFAVKEEIRNKSLGMCVNCILPETCIVNWSPEDGIDLSTYPSIRARDTTDSGADSTDSSGSDLSPKGPALEFVGNSWRIIGLEAG